LAPPKGGAFLLGLPIGLQIGWRTPKAAPANLVHILGRTLICKTLYNFPTGELYKFVNKKPSNNESPGLRRGFILMPILLGVLLDPHLRHAVLAVIDPALILSDVVPMLADSLRHSRSLILRNLPERLSEANSLTLFHLLQSVGKSLVDLEGTSTLSNANLIGRDKLIGTHCVSSLSRWRVLPALACIGTLSNAGRKSTLLGQESRLFGVRYVTNVCSTLDCKIACKSANKSAFKSVSKSVYKLVGARLRRAPTTLVRILG